MPDTFEIPVMTVPEMRPIMHDFMGSTKQEFESEMPPPDLPGAYIWSTTRERVLYVGSAKSLSSRLGREQGWLDRHDPESMWEVTVIHMLKVSKATVQWVPTADHAEALRLERALIEWHRARVGVAPVLVGWDAKPGSPQKVAQDRARQLWLQLHGGDPRRPWTRKCPPVRAGISHRGRRATKRRRCPRKLGPRRSRERARGPAPAPA